MDFRPGSQTTMGYRPALDGIRAFAIVGVMASHSALGVWGAGWIGVDVFFVLSGFLITTLLFEEMDREGRVSIRAFFLRRAFRLLPALAALLGVFSLWILVDVESVPGSGSSNVKGIVSSALYLSAWVSAFDLWPLGSFEHTWSLSVEEHFYAAWPFAFVMLHRRRARPLTIILGLYLLALSYRLMMVFAGASWGRIYAGPDTRAEQVLAGCLLAAILVKVDVRRAAPWLLRTGGAVAGLGLVVLADRFTGETHRQWGLSVTAILSMVLIASVFLRPDDRLARGLSWAPLAWIGRRSYGIYLWYWPVFRVFRAASWSSGWGRLAIELPIILALAMLSHRLVERPAQRWGRVLVARRRTGIAVLPA